MMRRLGAIPAPAPGHVPALAQRVALARLDRPARVAWHDGVDFTDGAGQPDALGNDRVGDCVPVAALRCAQMRMRHALHAEWRPTGEAALGLYRRWAGWDGTPYTDQGTDTAAAMAAWVREGIWIDAQLLDCGWWLTVDPHDQIHVEAAMAWFGPVQATFALPRGVETAANAWDVTGTGDAWRLNSWGAHRVAVSGYDADGTRTVVSWGETFLVTPSFWAAYAVGVDVMVAPSTWLDPRGVSPPGLDRDGLADARGRLQV